MTDQHTPGYRHDAVAASEGYGSTGAEESREQRSPGVSGRPAWINLASTGVHDARAFYAQLFGWVYEDQSGGLDRYLLIRQGDHVVGSIMDARHIDGAVESEWDVLLDVADVHGAVARVADHGGAPRENPEPVGDYGWQAYVADPGGAVIGLWQRRAMEGLEVSGEPGTPVWFEVMSTDYDRAVDFYRTICGWEIVPLGGEEEHGVRYATNGAGNEAVAGVCDAASWLGDGPSFWRIYFAVDDVDRALQRVAQLGGRLLDGPMDSPFGRLATVEDPQGAMFQIIQQPPDN